MKAVKLLAVLLVGILLGSIGSSLLTTHGMARALLVSRQRVAFEMIVTPQTFSEAENAKAVLQAVASQWVQDTHAEITRASRTRRVEGTRAAEEMLLRQTIEWVEKGVRELKGTEAEDTMQSYLLSLLLRARSDERWLDVYLDILYRHPTRNLVGRWAKDALRVAGRLDREDELMTAFRHVGAIPLDFPTKQWIGYALQRDNQSKQETLSLIQTEYVGKLNWPADSSGTMICSAPPLVN